MLEGWNVLDRFVQSLVDEPRDSSELRNLDLLEVPAWPPTAIHRTARWRQTSPGGFACWTRLGQTNAIPQQVTRWRAQRAAWLEFSTPVSVQRDAGVLWEAAPGLEPGVSGNWEIQNRVPVGIARRNAWQVGDRKGLQ